MTTYNVYDDHALCPESFRSLYSADRIVLNYQQILNIERLIQSFSSSMKQVSQVPCLGFEDDHCHTFSVQLPRDSRPVSGDDSRGASHLPSSHHHQLQVHTWQQLAGNFYNLNQNCLMSTTCWLSSYYYCKIIIISLLSTARSSVNFLVYYMASGRALSSLIPSVRRRSRWCYLYNSILGIFS